MNNRIIITILLITFVSISCFAQLTGSWDINSGLAQTTTTKAVGLNTTTPNARINLVNPVFCCTEDMQSFTQDPLHIQYSNLSTMLILKNTGMFGLQIANPNSYFHVNANSGYAKLFELTKTHGTSTSRLYFDTKLMGPNLTTLNPIIQSEDAGIIFSDNNNSSNISQGFVIAPRSSTNSGIRISANGDLEINNGRLVINDGTTNQFQVTANGLVAARQIDVHLDPIPDFVFHSAFDADSAAYYAETGQYKAMTLAEVDAFVQLNRHLPGIKSAAEYEQAGSINVGELQLQLLEKVEELTLYNIELMKQIQALQQRQILLEEQLKAK